MMAKNEKQRFIGFKSHLLVSIVLKLKNGWMIERSVLNA